MKIINFLLIIIICIFLIGCNDEEYTMKLKQMEDLINKNLKLGDSEGKITSFLESQGWLYEYDEYAKRFQGRDPDLKPINVIYGKKGHQIYIYVDETKSFKRAEVVIVTAGL